jgi:hypothetical protein
MCPIQRKISMTNLTRATLLFLATILILGSSAAYADHGRRINNVEDLLLNVASAFLVAQNAKYAALDRSQRSRHGHEYRRDRDNSARCFGGRHSYRDGYSGASFTSKSVRGALAERESSKIRIPIERQPALASRALITTQLI